MRHLFFLASPHEVLLNYTINCILWKSISGIIESMSIQLFNANSVQRLLFIDWSLCRCDLLCFMYFLLQKKRKLFFIICQSCPLCLICSAQCRFHWQYCSKMMLDNCKLWKLYLELWRWSFSNLNNWQFCFKILNKKIERPRRTNNHIGRKPKLRALRPCWLILAPRAGLSDQRGNAVAPAGAVGPSPSAAAASNGSQAASLLLTMQNVRLKQQSLPVASLHLPAWLVSRSMPASKDAEGAFGFSARRAFSCYVKSLTNTHNTCS